METQATLIALNKVISPSTPILLLRTLVVRLCQRKEKELPKGNIKKLVRTWNTQCTYAHCVLALVNEQGLLFWSITSQGKKEEGTQDRFHPIDKLAYS